MKRTRQPNNNPKLIYPVEQEPIILSKPLLDTFLSKSNPADLIALYCFYYYTAKWQKTNQPKATNNYCMEGLGWGYQKLYRTQQQLIELKLIEKLNTRDTLGKISGWYIKVNFIWKKDTTQNYQNPELVKSRTGKQKINALSYNNINALNSNNKNNIPPSKNPPIKERNATYLPLAKHLSDTIHTNKNIEHTTIQLNSWTNDIRQLVENNKVSYQRVQQMLEWYRKNIGGQYIPVIESGQSLRNKFLKLEAAMERQKRFTPSEPDSIIAHGRRWYRNEDGKYRTKTGELLPKE